MKKTLLMVPMLLLACSLALASSSVDINLVGEGDTSLYTSAIITGYAEESWGCPGCGSGAVVPTAEIQTGFDNIGDFGFTQGIVSSGDWDMEENQNAFGNGNTEYHKAIGVWSICQNPDPLGSSWNTEYQATGNLQADSLFQSYTLNGWTAITPGVITTFGVDALADNVFNMNSWAKFN